MSSESTETLNNTSESNVPDAPAAGAPAPDSAQAPVPDELATAKKEAAENYNRYLRAVADLENFRRRTVREKDELRQFAASGVLEELLPVVDNLTLALNAAKLPSADIKMLTGGVEMVLNQLKSSLAKNGLKEINPVAQPFDANLHESLSAQPHAEVPEGNVTQVVRTGFSLNGRLLRPASVVLSSGAPKEKS